MQGARSAILNSMSVFTVVIFACIFFKSDRMTWRKALGCIIGFLGILALNLGGKSGFHIPGRWYDYPQCPVWSQCFPADPRIEQEGGCFVGTGYSLSIGGALLVIPALLMGGYLPVISLWASLSFCCSLPSQPSVFALYNKLLSCNPVGKVAIYNSFIPVVEPSPPPLSWRNLLLEVSDSRRIGYCRNLYHQ